MAKGKKTKYPHWDDRILFERRIIGCIGDEMTYKEVSFLKVNDFSDDMNKKAWYNINLFEGNYARIICNAPEIMDFIYIYNSFDIMNLKEMAFFLVECNISKAIISHLEKISFETNNPIERDFLSAAGHEGVYLDAFVLHSSILTYIKPVASEKTFKETKNLIDRISERVKGLKKWG